MIEPEVVQPPRAPDTATARSRVAVWDLPVRIVHWLFVSLLVGLIVTGKLGADWLLWHMRFGQAVLALIAFRVIWGFVGSRNARFDAFLRGPSHVVRYARSLSRAHEQHATHNPLGGWMVILLLAALLAQALMGLFTNDDILWGGPLSEKVSKETSDAISYVHRRFWWVIVGLSVLHIGAVLAYLAMLKDNLILPMVTGYKHLPQGIARSDDASASTTKAVVLVALCGLAIWYALDRLAIP